MSVQYPNSGSATPSGPAGGVLAGTYPNPTLSTNAAFTVLTSATANPASVGQIRLAKTDQLTFRNDSNNADVGITVIADGILGVSNGTAGSANGGFQATAYYGSSNFSTTGVLRLASADTIGWRNNGNSANITLSKNTSDIFVFGSGVSFPTLQPSADSTTAFIIYKTNGTTAVLNVDTTNVKLSTGSAGVYGWSSTAAPAGTLDTGISRGAANQINFGNGTAANATAACLAGNFSNNNQTTAVDGNGISLGSGKVANWSSSAGFSSAIDTGLSRTGVATLALGNGTASSTTGTFVCTTLQAVAVAVASLPASPVEGMRASVNNSNAVSFTAGIGTVVTGGGTTHVPVYYDGTNWRIG